MPPNECQGEVLAALGREDGKLSPTEKALIYRHAAKLKARIDAGGDAEAVLKNFAEEREAAKEHGRVVAAGNETAFQAGKDRFTDAGDFGTKAPGEVLKSMGISSPKSFFGAADSLGKRIPNTQARFLNAFMYGLEKAGLSKYVFEGSDQLNIWKAWDAINRGEDASGFGSNAVQAATIMRNSAWALWKTMQAANYPIGKIEEWVGPQFHDPYAVGQAGGNRLGSNEAAKAWVSSTAPRVDWNKSFGGELAAATPALQMRRLESLWTQYKSGEHINFGGIDPGKSRELFFKSVEDQFAYNQEFGGGRSLGENVFGWLHRASRDMEVYKMFGSNPESMVGRLATEQSKRINADETLSAQEKANSLGQIKQTKKGLTDRWLPSLAGNLGIPETAALRHAYEINHTVNSLLAIGASPVLIGDLPLFMDNMVKMGGTGIKKYFGNVRDTLGRMAQMPAEEQKKAAALSEIMLSDLTVPLARSIGGEFIPGLLKQGEQVGYKIGGHTAWVDRLRTAATTMFGAYHWLERGKKFGALDPVLQSQFQRFGIGEKEWNVIRGSESSPTVAYGHEAFGPALIRKTEGVDPKLASRVADRYGEFLGHFADTMTSQPSEEIRAITSGGISRNGWLGFGTQMLSGLKTFTYRLTRDHYGADIANDADPHNVGWAKMTKNFMLGRGGSPTGRLGMLKFAANNAMFGAMIVQLSLIRSGKAPIMPDSPEAAGKLLMMGFLRQGASLYGDVVAKALEDPDKSVWDSMAAFASPSLEYGGDILGALLKAGDATRKYATGQVSKSGRVYGEDQWAKALRTQGQKVLGTAYSLTPGTQIPWTKFATDFYLKDNLLDWANPGYKDRLIKRAQQGGTPLLLAPQTTP